MPVTYKAGDKVCDYQIEELLGQGGFSQIYKAKDPAGAQVILKFPEVSLLGDLATYERFRREVSIGQKLNHPAIPKAILFKEKADCVFLVMEYIEGVSLRTYISEHAPLPLDNVYSFIDQLAEAIEYLHAHGVYHRDLKPENIIVGSDNKIHILDFGSALLEGSRRVTWRWASNTFGTPDYMAPEQIQGKRGDSRTDMYALGIIMFEMLTGTLPFQGDNALSIMNQHLTALPASPRKIKPSIPEGIEAIVLKSIRRDPDKRYQTINEFREDLHHYNELDLSQFPLGPEEGSGGLLDNRQIWIRSLLIFFGFLAIAAIIVFVVYLMQHR